MDAVFLVIALHVNILRTLVEAPRSIANGSFRRAVVLVVWDFSSRKI